MLGMTKTKVTVRAVLSPACYICAEPNNPVGPICKCCGMPTPPSIDLGEIAATDAVKPGFIEELLRKVRDGKRSTHDQGG